MRSPGTDSDDKISSEEEEFSDDEAEQFEFAPPVTVMETIMAAGIERETKKINFRLRTAPPIPAALAVRPRRHEDGGRSPLITGDGEEGVEEQGAV